MARVSCSFSQFQSGYDSDLTFISFQYIYKRRFKLADSEWKTEEDLEGAYASIEDFEEAAKEEGLDLEDLSNVLLLSEASKKLGYAKRYGWKWALGLC